MREVNNSRHYIRCLFSLDCFFRQHISTVSSAVCGTSIACTRCCVLLSLIAETIIIVIRFLALHSILLLNMCSYAKRREFKRSYMCMRSICTTMPTARCRVRGAPENNASMKIFFFSECGKFFSFLQCYTGEFRRAENSGDPHAYQGERISHNVMLLIWCRAFDVFVWIVHDVCGNSSLVHRRARLYTVPDVHTHAEWMRLSREGITT